MGKRLTRPLACGLALSVVLSSAAAQDARLSKSDERLTETMLPAEKKASVLAGT